MQAICSEGQGPGEKGKMGCGDWASLALESCLTFAWQVLKSKSCLRLAQTARIPNPGWKLRKLCLSVSWTGGGVSGVNIVDFSVSRYMVAKSRVRVKTKIEA